MAPPADRALARQLVLDELFDLTLYRAFRRMASGDLRRILDELIPVEERHLAFWQQFFGLPLTRLDAGRRIKLAVIVALCRLLGAPAMHLVLEAIEVFGVRKYLRIWRLHGDRPLGAAVREVLEDELRHEDAVVSGDARRRISPDRVRNIFLGLNDGLVEIVGAVSGFFGAFGDAVTVLIAGSTVAVAGALSMAAGAWVAASSELEVRETDLGRRSFLGDPTPPEDDASSPFAGALLVGGSYFAGALVPVLPVLFGARSALPSAITAGAVIVVVSMVLAFLSGMNVGRRIATNLGIIAAAAGVTYLIGMVTRRLWGIGA
jgi:VIT1/CCC1 family predicted Fe2+/Mn2+ transporter